MSAQQMYDADTLMQRITIDPYICHGKPCIRDHSIVVTKDADFVNTFTVQRVPYKLLLVSTGNIKNVALEALFAQHIADITAAFESHDFVELTRTVLIIHA